MASIDPKFGVPVPSDAVPQFGQIPIVIESDAMPFTMCEMGNYFGRKAVFRLNRQTGETWILTDSYGWVRCGEEKAVCQPSA